MPTLTPELTSDLISSLAATPASSAAANTTNTMGRFVQGSSTSFANYDADYASVNYDDEASMDNLPYETMGCADVKRASRRVEMTADRIKNSGPTKFFKRFCPNVFDGVEQIVEWMGIKKSSGTAHNSSSTASSSGGAHNSGVQMASVAPIIVPAMVLPNLNNLNCGFGGSCSSNSGARSEEKSKKNGRKSSDDVGAADESTSVFASLFSMDYDSSTTFGSLTPKFYGSINSLNSNDTQFESNDSFSNNALNTPTKYEYETAENVKVDNNSPDTPNSKSESDDPWTVVDEYPLADVLLDSCNNSPMLSGMSSTPPPTSSSEFI